MSFGALPFLLHAAPRPILFHARRRRQQALRRLDWCSFSQCWRHFLFHSALAFSKVPLSFFKMMRRSSSLGEESNHDYYSHSQPTKSWRRRPNLHHPPHHNPTLLLHFSRFTSIDIWSHCRYSACTNTGWTFLFRSTTLLSSCAHGCQACGPTF